jgi:ParB-like chromosome segregation protein Spo0J
MAVKKMTSVVKMWLVDRLIPYLWTARTHSDQHIGQIAASVREFGLTNVILVDSSATVIAGQGRLLAARKLGITQLPIIILDHLTEAQKGPASLNNSSKETKHDQPSRLDRRRI